MHDHAASGRPRGGYAQARPSCFWEGNSNQVFVAVRDERQGTSVEIEIDPAHARDAFLHPFAYAQALDDYPLAA
jgi:hypothetical protein